MSFNPKTDILWGMAWVAVVLILVGLGATGFFSQPADESHVESAGH